MNPQEPSQEPTTPRSGRVRGHCAGSAIDSAAAMLVGPRATPLKEVAAHSFLREELAPDGQPNTCGAENIETVRGASTLSPEDQKWLQMTLRRAD
jgi:hypothetical protein